MINYYADADVIEFLAHQHGASSNSPLDVLICIEEMSEEESREAVEMYIHDLFLNRSSL